MLRTAMLRRGVLRRSCDLLRDCRSSRTTWDSGTKGGGIVTHSGQRFVLQANSLTHQQLYSVGYSYNLGTQG
jgi:hypothetical protein